MLSEKNFHPLLKTLDSSGQRTYYSNICEYIDRYTPLSQKLPEGKFDEGLRLISAFKSNRPTIALLNRDRMPRAEKLQRLEAMLLNAKKYCIDFCGVTSSPSPSPTSNTAAQQSAVPATPTIAKISRHVGRPSRAEMEAKQQAEVLRKGRPQHISDYLHLLPAHIQEEYKGIQNLYNEMSHAHHSLQCMVLEDASSSLSERARYAQYVCRKEERILNFWHRVDTYWEKSQGLDVSEETIKKLEDESNKLKKEDRDAAPPRLPGSYSKMEIDRMPDGEQKEIFKKARILRNQKFLRRKDRVNTNIDWLKTAIEELHEWGLWITERQAKEARELGIAIPEEYIAPSKEERNRIAEAKYEAKRAKARRERTEELRRMRQEIADDNPYKQAGLNFID